MTVTIAITNITIRNTTTPEIIVPVFPLFLAFSLTAAGVSDVPVTDDELVVPNTVLVVPNTVLVSVDDCELVIVTAVVSEINYNSMY